MKKMLLLVLVILILTGCTNAEEPNIDIELTKGKYTSVCTKVDEYDGYKIKTVTTTNYGEDKIAINTKTYASYKFTDKSQYDYYSANGFDRVNINDMVMDYVYDDDSMIYKTILAYKTLNLREEEKENFKIENVIKDSENNNEECELQGITRKELGLE